MADIGPGSYILANESKFAGFVNIADPLMPIAIDCILQAEGGITT